MWEVDFTKVRPIFGGKLNQVQVDGIEAIVREANAQGLADATHLGYALATAYWETGGKMAPVEENLNYTSAKRIVEVWPKRFASVNAAAPFCRQPEKLANKVYGDRKDLGNYAKGDGWKYRGRGLPQLTGRKNYAKFGYETKPDELLKLPVAAKVLVEGLKNGLFTGKKLGDYGTGADFDFVAARATVNADVKANGEKIATIALAFTDAVRRVETAGEVAPQPEPPAPTPMPTPETAMPWWITAVIIGVLLAVVAAIIEFIL